MKTISAHRDEANIINRREIMPLLAKARQVLGHYEKAMDCFTAVLDKSGKAVEIQKQLCPCDFCGETHQAALAESRQAGGVHIYVCEEGFVYWTSPLYRNGRYAGALIAGQVRLSEKKHEEILVMAEMLRLCAEEISDEKESPGDINRSKSGLKTWQNGISKKPSGQLKIVSKTNRTHYKEANFEYPLEKERVLLAAFRRGDNETGGKILKELMNCILTAMPDNLEVVRFRAIELAVLLSRAAMPDASGSDTLLETNNRYIKRILESKTAEELQENLQLAAERMSGKIFSFQGIRHASVLRRAERYIWENYTRKISLEEIAKASGLSAPYFSTVFKEERGENLSSYLNRLRVERAAALLAETGKPLNEIAKLCGFEDQSWFSKIFKSFAGISPGRFRENGGGAQMQMQLQRGCL